MKGLVTGVVAAAALALSAGSASAVVITVSPSAAGLSNAPNFSFEGIRTSDFSSINLTATSATTFSFVEHGYLPIASFDPGNFTPPGLNGTAGATKYQLYLEFTGNGTVTTIAPGTQQGSFSSLTYTLKGDAGFNSSFNHFSATHQVQCVGCGTDTTLANGSLLAGGTNIVSISPGQGGKPLPAAFVDLEFNAISTAFFVSPAAPFTLELDTQFSNTSNVTARYTTNLPSGVSQVITIGTTGNVGGSGTGQFVTSVPEPASMMLLGTGLLGLGLIRRRISK